MKYIVNDSWDYVIMEDDSFLQHTIPKDVDNRDYTRYLECRDKGYTPETWVPEAVDVPVVISRKQGLFWLVDNLGVTEDVIKALIKGIPDEIERYKSKISFETDRWWSNDPYVQMFGASIGLDTPHKLRSAFKAAMEE